MRLLKIHGMTYDFLCHEEYTLFNTTSKFEIFFFPVRTFLCLQSCSSTACGVLMKKKLFQLSTIINLNEIH